MLGALRTIVPLEFHELVDGFCPLPKLINQAASALFSRFKNVLKCDDCTSKLGTDGPAQKTVPIEYTNLGRVTRIVAQHHRLADVGCERRIYVTQPLESNSVWVNL